MVLKTKGVDIRYPLPSSEPAEISRGQKISYHYFPPVYKGFINRDISRTHSEGISKGLLALTFKEDMGCALTPMYINKELVHHLVHSKLSLAFSWKIPVFENIGGDYR